MRFSANIGVVAGLVWGVIWQACAIFQFTRRSPTDLLEAFLPNAHWPIWVIWLLSLVLFVVFSSLVAVCLARFSKKGGTIMRSLFLALCVTSLLAFTGDVTFSKHLFANADWNTLITNFCLAAQWGLFIDVSLRATRTQEK